MFSTSVGLPDDTRGRRTLVGEKDKAGYLLFGPFAPLERGSYVVTFLLEVENAQHDESVVCGRADVAIDTGTNIIAQTSLYGSRLSRPGPTAISLSFKLNALAEVEFRVYTTGRFRMIVEPMPVVRVCLGNEAAYCPVFPIGYAPRHALVDRNLGDIRFLFENGAEIVEDDRGLVGSCNGVKFFLENAEDFQIVNEIFFSNDYNVVSSRRAIFIDIGMNVGMTSLFAASKPHIDSVFSFEPFQGPYQRAQRNFTLNPELAKKITAAPFGMGKADANMQVTVDPHTSIGTSIRGNAEGSQEGITIREAASSLSNILARAKEEEKAVFLKIDCEGSEFPVMESLDQGGLLRSIDVVMIEWHKWWSADLTAQDLIRPLLKNGFVVFDKTTPANIFAGMIYAVRQ